VRRQENGGIRRGGTELKVGGRKKIRGSELFEVQTMGEKWGKATEMG